MKLKEYQGKHLFSSFGIPIAKGVVVSSLDQVDEKRIPEACVLKPQVRAGKRGKGGKIIFCSRSQVIGKLPELLGKKFKGEIIDEVLIEERKQIKREMYLGITLNRAEKCFTLVFSKEGGVDIEYVAKTSPKKVITHSIITDIPDVLPKDILPIAQKLWKMVKEKDCLLAEINPLIETPEGNIIALDAKVVIDDNALFRQMEGYEELPQSIENDAKKKGIHYVQLPGDIGIIGNGAGLVMATMDVITSFGGKPADFLDVGGGANEEKTAQCLALVEKNNPKGIFINIFGGITHCDDVANAIVSWHKGKSVPIVVRMIGTNEEEARRILEKNHIHAITSMEQGAKKIVG